MRLGDLDALKEEIEKRIEHDNAEDFDKGYNIALQGVVELIDNAPTIEPFERIGSICDENCGYRPQGEYVEKYEKILQIVEHWNDKSSSFVSACEAFEKILDVTKGGAV